MDAIEIKGLVKEYGNGRGLHAIDLVAAPGEIVGFLGPNGAGKSTSPGGKSKRQSITIGLANEPEQCITLCHRASVTRANTG